MSLNRRSACRTVCVPVAQQQVSCRHGAVIAFQMHAHSDKGLLPNLTFSSCVSSYHFEQICHQLPFRCGGPRGSSPLRLQVRIYSQSALPCFGTYHCAQPTCVAQSTLPGDGKEGEEREIHIRKVIAPGARKVGPRA